MWLPSLVNAEKHLDPTDTATLEERINKAKEERKVKISEFIENKLIFIEISDDYKNLDKSTKILFFETLLKKVEKRLETTKNWNAVDVLNVFSDKIKERLDNLYWAQMDDEEVILELIEPK